MKIFFGFENINKLSDAIKYDVSTKNNIQKDYHRRGVIPKGIITLRTCGSLFYYNTLNLRRSTIPMTKLQRFKKIRARHLISFRRYLALKGDGTAVIDYLNMDAFELREHLSAQWLPQMNWDNYCQLWVVDHIVPMKYFDPTIASDMRLCWSYENLKPSYLTDNHAKGLCIEVTKNTLLGMRQTIGVRLLLNKIEGIKDMFNPYYSKVNNG